MSARFSAFRFVHPEFDALDRRQAGLVLAPTGGVELVVDAEAIRQALMLLLTTQPGERVMRPEYGCHLHRLLFAPNDATTAGLAMHYVRSAVQRWEPRVEVLQVDAGASVDDATILEIRLDYRIRATLERGLVEYALVLTDALRPSRSTVVRP